MRRRVSAVAFVSKRGCKRSNHLSLPGRKVGYTYRVTPHLIRGGSLVLAIDLRGYDKSRGPGHSNPMDAPLHLDVLAAVRYLHKTGAQSASVVGGSMGGGAAGDASIASRPGEIDRLVLLGAAPNGPADKLKSSTPFIVARDDASEDGPRLPGIRE